MTAMLPYGRQSITDDDVAAVVATLRSDWLTTGPQVDAFEADLAGWTGGAGCAAVANGTAALHVAYAAAGVGPGDEVVVPPMTFVATASSAVALGARIVFADVEEETFTLDPAAAAAATTARTKVVAAVDYAGHPADYDALRAALAGSDALLLADAAHSIGATYRGRPVGSLADLTTFSFFPTKNLTTAEGGAVATAEPELLKRARRFRNIGLVRERAELRAPDEGGWHQEVHEFGLNYRLPDVLCALGRSQLRRLGDFLAARARLVARYDEALADLDEVLPRPAGRGPPPPGTSTRSGSSTAAAARCTTGCAPPASAYRSTTCRCTGTRPSPTSVTGAGPARWPSRSTVSSSRCRCTRASPTPTRTG